MKKSAKKSIKTGRAIRPPRSPVLPIRVPQPVYDELKEAAKTAGMTLSEFVNRLIDRGQEWQKAIGDAQNLLRQANAEAKRIVDSTLEAELRRRNWKRIAGAGTWAPPDVHGFSPDGFTAEPESSVAAAADRLASASVTEPLDPRITTEIKRAVQAALKDRRAR